MNIYSENDSTITNNSLELTYNHTSNDNFVRIYIDSDVSSIEVFKNGNDARYSEYFNPDDQNLFSINK